MQTFTHNGLQFRLTTEHDSTISEPWREYDGHGIVTNRRHKETKGPHERILRSDNGCARFYDWRASMEKARRQGWGLSDESKAALAKTLNCEPAPDEILTESVRLDFERLRGFCNDEWSYLVLHVELMSLTKGEPDRDSYVLVPEYDDYLGGVASDSGDSYVLECAREMADSIIRAHDIKPDQRVVSREYTIR